VQEDIDECATGVDKCDSNAICQDTEVRNSCTCSESYEGDEFTCTDIDTCDCPSNAICENTKGSYCTCVCTEGLKETGSPARTVMSVQPTLSATPMPSARMQKKFTGKQWASKLIKLQWQAAHEVWIQRCTELHDKEDGILTAREM
jgi:hypothetical protein